MPNEKTFNAPLGSGYGLNRFVRYGIPARSIRWRFFDLINRKAMDYIKHRFNIFPEMQADDYYRLVEDLSINGYDQKQPIYLYQDRILDGWNREKGV